MTDTKKTSARAQILAISAQMADDQVALAREIAEFIGGEEGVAIINKLNAFRERSVPNSTLDQQLGGFINQFVGMGQVSAQVFEQLARQQATAKAQA